ncbi:transglutaminase domain-containing protein [Flavobacterium foetidum]|uniref:transglutaminase domain-containing protein n=1 Tax=Flavobacterium foetidum TaxID=2026681 RepID=UPI001074A7D1|nr:transglutaminase domain-containing protein [Flavobacterium foetidum]KAF2517207.1 transglutaminase domain-containing protein [Flavobacterium foetidum]
MIKKRQKTSKFQCSIIRISKVLATFFLIPFLAKAQYSAYDVESVLKKAGSNRQELEKALEYSKNTGDPLKAKAMQFLIANMDIHFSSDFYWEDAQGRKIAYNELDYPDYAQAQKALDIIKQQNPGCRTKAIIYKDIETIKGDYLIRNLENAFKAWNSSAIKKASFDDFCEYILPYRVSVEPVQDWRTDYSEKFGWINDQITKQDFKSTLYYVKDDYDIWFTNTWGEQRKEPLPRLGGLQLLFRKAGPCTDIADLSVLTMRSQGIPASVNVIPFWATSTGGHFMNTIFDNTMKAYNCDFGSKNFGENLQREPAKVLRLTYSKRSETLASFEDVNNIPEGILQQQNYIDVTNEYWETSNVNCPLYSSATDHKIVYATTFNGLKWRPFWWGKVENGQTTFSSICKNTVLIPHYYSNGKLIPAGAPVLVRDKGSRVLVPDLENNRDVIIKEADRYLKFKIGVTYKLFYWNNGWKLVDAREVKLPTASMLFTKVPKNSLLLFLAGDSKKKLERPFTVDDNGERTWY